jgi:hypothetical protein
MIRFYLLTVFNNPIPKPTSKKPHPQRVIAENQNLKVLQLADIIGQRNNLIGAQIQLHHARPRANVQRQRRQLIRVDIQRRQVLGKRENAVRNLVNLIVLHVDRVDRRELGWTCGFVICILVIKTRIEISVVIY